MQQSNLVRRNTSYPNKAIMLHDVVSESNYVRQAYLALCNVVLL